VVAESKARLRVFKHRELGDVVTGAEGVAGATDDQHASLHIEADSPDRLVQLLLHRTDRALCFSGRLRMIRRTGPSFSKRKSSSKSIGSLPSP